MFMASLVIIMYNQQNSDHPKSPHLAGPPPPISPRISFSNDFADAAQFKPAGDYDGPVSSDFEFSVPNYSMMSADELFYNGRFLPFKDNGGRSGGRKPTLRDELLAGHDEDGGGVPLRPVKASGSSSSFRWKGFMGLRKSHIVPRRSDKGDGSKFGPGQDDAQVSRNSQEMMNEGGGSSHSRDGDFRLQ